MLQILLHSSKTMATAHHHEPLEAPRFLSEAASLARVVQKASLTDLSELMHISHAKAIGVKKAYDDWSIDPGLQSPAIDAFKGDIYSGLQVHEWSDYDRAYAHSHLVVLSGLYGALRACDGIMPYRLEMGYKLPGGESMYSFWGSMLANVIQPKTKCIINLSAIEYTKALLPHINHRFLHLSS